MKHAHHTTATTLVLGAVAALAFVLGRATGPTAPVEPDADASQAADGVACGAASRPWTELLVPPAQAAVPTSVPSFSAPLEIGNAYLPVVPGAVKVYAGREGRVPIVIVETHRTEPREFEWDGGTVECRVVEQLLFERGRLAGREQRYYAQSDDGAVWTFGEVEDDDPDDDDGDDADEPNGWVVGSRAPTDPQKVVEFGVPMLTMPAQPEAGDSWAFEDLPPELVSIRQVRDTGSTVRVPNGRYLDAVRVREEDVADDTRESLWFARGVGLVRTRAPRERLALQATTIETDE